MAITDEPKIGVNTGHADGTQPAPKRTANSKSVNDRLILYLRGVNDSKAGEKIIEDLQARRNEGIKKCGVELLSFNGRDALLDAYQESLDMIVYLSQVRLEDDGFDVGELFLDAVRVCFGIKHMLLDRGPVA